MALRIVSGLIGIGLFVALCFAGSLPFLFAITAIASIAAGEFTRAEMHASPVTDLPAWAAGLDKIYRLANPFFVCLSVVLLPMAFALNQRAEPRYIELYAFILVAAVTAGLVLVARAWNTGWVLGWFRAFYGKVGFWYIGATLSALILLRGLPGRVRIGRFAEMDRGAWIVLCVAVCVWSTDTFAFFTGKALGRHKLAPKLSPGKTIEGFVGGLIGAVIVGTLFGKWIALGWTVGAVLGAIAGLVGPMGDLFESGLKRELGIKDFGAIMPGHGGALDRFDSLMFVAPIAYLYLTLVSK